MLLKNVQFPSAPPLPERSVEHANCRVAASHTSLSFEPEHEVSPAPENVAPTLRFVDVAFVSVVLAIVAFVTVMSANVLIPINELFEYVFGMELDACAKAAAEEVENAFAR